MKIAANSLEAFLAVARAAHFSRAAKALAISQSALSQRILNLESQLETTLFVRNRAGARLTPEGEELLRYAQSQEALEEEFLASRSSDSLAGSLRLGGFSSVTRSILMPALAPLCREHAVKLNIFSREMSELPDLLRQGEADLVVLDHALEKEGVRAELLGFEENVLVRSKKWKQGREFFLDHDAADPTTQRYLQKFGTKGTKPARRFLDEVYNLVEGVKLGFGQAVLSRHLVAGDKELEIVDPAKVLKSAVWLHYPEQAYYPKLQLVAREAVMAYARARLPQK